MRSTSKTITILMATAVACAAPTERADVRKHGQRALVTNIHTLEGYASKTSATTGETLDFYVHSQEAVAYTVKLYRYGKDSGAELLAGPFTCAGAEQHYEDTAYKDGAGWNVSFSLAVPAQSTMLTLAPCSGSAAVSKWSSGVYVARLESANSPAFDVTFVVKDAAADRKSIVIVASTHTWQAYNFWPEDNSYYSSNEATTEVNFKRPNPYATPEPLDENGAPWILRRTEHLANGLVQLARWFERNEQPYSMISDSDLHAGWSEVSGTTALDPFTTVVLGPHSEYWSEPMYKSLTAYLSRGGNLVSIGGNNVFRHVDIDANDKMTNLDVPIGNAWWDNYEVGNPPTWTNFVSKRRLMGSEFSGAPHGECRSFLPTAAAQSGTNKLAHWSFANIVSGTPLGAMGEIVPNSSVCTNGTSGASGEEVDYAFTGFAREYTILASREHFDAQLPPNKLAQGDIFHMRRASAGQIFSIGSIRASGAFAAGDVNLTELLKNVLARTTKPAFSDFSGDGSTDLIGFDATSGYLWLKKVNADGSDIIEPAAGFDGGWEMFDTIASPGDLDGDGASDLLARKPNGDLLFYRGAGNGTLIQDPGVLVASGWSAYVDIVTPGDFDGDGRPDVLTRKADGTLWLHRGSGTGAFATAQLLDTGWDQYVEVMSPGDFDDDGIPDLVARKADDSLHLVRGKGDGTFHPTTVPIDHPSGWTGYDRLIAGGDINHDGHADVLALVNGTLTLYHGTGYGTFVGGGSQLGGVGAFTGFATVVSVW